MPLKFHFKDTSISNLKRKRLRSFIIDIFDKEGTTVKSLDYIFCNDEYLLDINKTFLNHHDYTDIITFNMAEITDPIVGEVYISVDRVTENSLKFNISFIQELHRVMFHGALHLCGYKDGSKQQRILMRAMEDEYLDLYAI